MSHHNHQPPLLSVCIPTYEMHGLGDKFLKTIFDSLTKQTFQDFDVIISDNSATNVIKKVCDVYKNKLTIHYYKNHDQARGMATNINNSIKKATGQLIKILFLDDLLYDNSSLELIVKNFDLKKDHWLISGYTHTKDGVSFFKPQRPSYNDQIHLGENSIGCPSVLTIKNSNPLLFDVRLKWFVDCDYYKRYHDKFGAPKVLKKTTAVIRMGEHQVTNTEINDTIKKTEHQYLVRKHKPAKKGNLNLKNVTLVAVSGINPAGAVRALELSMKGIDYYDVVLISHHRPPVLPEKITFRQCLPTELASKDPKNKDDYSRFMAYELCHYIDSDYCLIVHNDAYVLRPYRWSDQFFDYDYIGAPWPAGVHFTKEGVNVRVGNGGFSFRSRKMLNALNDFNLPFTDAGTGYFNEDGIMCVYYRKQLEDNGIKFAPVPLASRFSHEVDCPDSDAKPFGFHNNKKVVPFLRRQNKSAILKFHPVRRILGKVLRRA